MSYEKFTPGPWEVDQYCTNSISIMKDDQELAAIMAAEYLSEQDWANARLIAAAPAMYRALEAMQIVFESFAEIAPFRIADRCDRAVVEIEDVLKAARGDK